MTPRIFLDYESAVGVSVRFCSSLPKAKKVKKPICEAIKRGPVPVATPITERPAERSVRLPYCLRATRHAVGILINPLYEAQ
jgi:hypothetical protein